MHFRKKLCSESFRAYLQLLYPLGESDYSGEMLVMGGEEDQIFTTKEMEQTARTYGADLDIIPGVAHDMMLDPKNKEVAATILRWLEK